MLRFATTATPRPPLAVATALGALLAALLTGCGGSGSAATPTARDCATAPQRQARARDTAALLRALAPACGHAALRAATACGPAATTPAPAPRAASLPAPASTRRALIRIDQVGYAAACPKLARLMSSHPLSGASFAVLDAHGSVAFRGRVGRVQGNWGARWPYVYTLDFGPLRLAGRYRLRVGSARSPAFSVAGAAPLYAPLTANELAFFQAQRDGPNVIAGALHRQPAHLHDERATVYATPRYRGTSLVGPLSVAGGPVDVSGGWFDAGDYLKFVATGAFSDTLMLFALREYRGSIDNSAALLREARFETDWLLKMWDPARRVLYYQVGIGDGRGDSILGDHDVWRLPEADDHGRPNPRSATFFETYRPVFAANLPGATISPNLAGIAASAFGLCAQVFRAPDPAYAHRCLRAGQQLFDMADLSWSGPLLASTPSAYYRPKQWRDDIELAADELYLATLADHGASLPHPDPRYYLKPAATAANAYEIALGHRDVLADTLNLDDVSALAHYDLYRIMLASGNTTNLETDAPTLTADMHDALSQAAQLAAADPFGLADTGAPSDTVAHALGVAVEARLYDQLSASQAFEPQARAQLAWVLGENAWGSSFVVDAGTTFPGCLAHQVANLAGALPGQPGPLLAGAVVDGPTGSDALGDLGAPDGFRRCPRGGGDPYRQFDARGSAYLDAVTSPSTSEPSDDTAAIALLAFAQQAAAG